MRLDIITPDSTTDQPSEDAIQTAIDQAYAEKVAAVILVSDEENNAFMQLPGGGFHIEYCDSPKGPVYAHEDVEIDLAKELFLSYASNDERWRTMVSWDVIIKRL